MDFVKRFKSLPVSTKRLLGLGVVVAMVVALPLFIWAVVTQNFNPFKKAASGEPVTIPINWSSGSISITADDFYVTSNGERYDGNSNITINPGPSGANAEGIEIVSNANGNTVRLQMTFQKDPNNYTWWVSQIDYANNKYPYDSSSFTGTYFKSVLGYSFQDPGNITMLVRNPSNNQVVAELHYTNLRIQGFVGQTPPPTACLPQPLIIQAGGVEGQTGINQKYRLYFDVYRNDPACMGSLAVNLSARVPDGWIVSFEHPSFSIASNYNFYTTVDITPTTFNVINEPIIIYATTVYPQSTASQRIYINVGQTPQPLPTPPYPNYCPRSCNSNYDCSYMLNCVQGTCRNPSCASSTNCICGPTPPPYTPTPTPPVCQPRPGCLDTVPACKIPEPIGGWCVGAGECQMCGGIAGIQCASGLVCQMPNVTYPDQSGTCVKSDGSSLCAQPAPRSFEMFFKFDGVDDNSANGAGVTVRFVSQALGNGLGLVTNQPIPATYVDNGVYKLDFSLPSTELPPASDYGIILKGEKHLHVKFCTNGQTTHCLLSDPGHITFSSDYSKTISLNFIGIPLPAGDVAIPTQDDVIDANDFNAIKNLTSKLSTTLTPQDIFVGDLNYDGKVDTRDLFLIRKSLETRYD